MTTNTILRESESVRKSGRARLTKRPRMLGATAASTKYRSATTTQNIGSSQTAATPAASGDREFGGAEPGNLDQYPVACRWILNRDHAAGHHDHPAPQWRPRCRELIRKPNERIQR